MKTPVVMKDIATALVGSVETVSKALSCMEGTDEELRPKIVEEANSQGYRKNANTSRQGTSHNSGVLVREHRVTEHRVITTLIQEIIKYLTDLGYYAIEELIVRLDFSLEKGHDDNASMYQELLEAEHVLSL